MVKSQAKKVYVYNKVNKKLGSLKPGIDKDKFFAKWPGVVQVNKMPGIKTLEKYSDGISRALDGCKVEPDGVCCHGLPSWLIVAGLI